MRDLVLQAQHPMAFFHQDSDGIVYNESLVALLGSQVDIEISDLLRRMMGPQVREVWTQQKPVWIQDQQVAADLERYWSCSFSVISEAKGVLVIVDDTTEKVISLRRTKILQTFSRRMMSCRELADLSKVMVQVISENSLALPFVRVYWRRTPFEMLSPIVSTEQSPLPEYGALPEILEHLNVTREPVHLPAKNGFSGAFVQALASQSGQMIKGAVVYGLHPRLAFNTSYRSFLEHLTLQLETALQVQMAETIRSEDEQWLGAVLSSIGDAVVAVDGADEPKISFMNPVAEQMTGWSLLESKGVSVFEVLNISHSKRKRPLANLISEILKSGSRKNSSNGNILISRSGREFLIEDSGSVLRTRSGHLTGIVLVFRDITEEKRAEMELEVERRKLLAFFQQTPLPLAMTEGPLHRFTFANSTYTQLFLGGRDVIGQTVTEASPEVIEQGFLPLLDEVYRTGIAFSGKETQVEVTTAEQTKRKFFLNFSYHPMRDVEGQVLGILVAATDVTEQVLSRRYIQNQQNWLESILNRLPMGLLMMDPKINKIKFMNKTAISIFGVGSKALQQKKLYGKDIRIYDADGRLLEESETPTARLARGEEIKGEEIVLETSAGRFQLVAVSEKIPQSYGHEETAILLLQDISAVRSVQQQFRLFTELAPQMPFIADVNGAFIYLSRRWHEYVGPSASEAGLADNSIYHPEDIERTIRTWIDCVRTGKPYEIEYRLRRHDGVYRWHLGRASAIRDESGKITKWFGFNVDIHDQRNLLSELQAAKNQAEIANATKSSFLANMSHEIRTPLGAILGFAELLKSSDLPEKEREFVEVIERNGQALTKVIDDILDLSKVESGKMSTELVPFSLIEVVEDVMALFSDRTRSQGIYLHCDLQEAPKGAVVSDPTRIRQILVNLVGNAVKFTSQGGVRITVNSRNIKTGWARIAIRVEDTGPGMTPAQSEKLFRPFVQADESTSRKFGGTGLGLALSRRLARVLKGDVYLEHSELNQGSIFVFELESEIQERTPPRIRFIKKSDRELEKKSLRLNGVRILIVDDSADNRFLMNLLLRREGAKVDEAGGGEEALQKTGQQTHDVVLMDIQMPGIDGYKTLSLLKERHYDRPVIALTAHAMLEERKRTQAAGFVDHVTKPVDREKLVEAILNQLH